MTISAIHTVSANTQQEFDDVVNAAIADTTFMDRVVGIQTHVQCLPPSDDGFFLGGTVFTAVLVLESLEEDA
jgi:hypothetical protein